MHKILVPVDGSIHALKALAIAGDLADKYNATLVLLHVISPDKSVEDLLDLAVANTFGPKAIEILREAAGKQSGSAPTKLLRSVGEKILEHAAAKVKRLGLDVEILEMSEGDPAEAILLARQRTNANTIVMGSRGVAAANGPAFGSVSQVVFEKAPCTCLSVK